MPPRHKIESPKMGAFHSIANHLSSPASPPTKRPQSDDTEERASKRFCRINTSGLLLDKVDKAAINKFENSLKKSDVRKAEARQGPFRFSQLPAELRERVYDFVFINKNWGSHTYNLTLSQPSSISTVYPEALRRFYTTAHFEVNIQTNHFNRSLPGVALCRSGVLNMKKSIKNAVRSAGNLAVFRHLTFYISDASLPIKRENPMGVLARIVVELKFVRGALRCDVKPGCFKAAREDQDRVSGTVQSVVAEIGSRDKFEGLTLGDLETIARVFRIRN